MNLQGDNLKYYSPGMKRGKQCFTIVHLVTCMCLHCFFNLVDRWTQAGLCFESIVSLSKCPKTDSSSGCLPATMPVI